jgi:uncharacterized membrane protein
MILIFVPTAGGILFLIGLIFVLIAVKGYGDAYKEGSIFQNTLYTVVFEIVGFVIFIGIAIYGLMGFLSSIGFNSFTDFSSWTRIDWQNAITPSTILPFVGAFILGLVVLFAFTVLAALYFRKAMKTMSEKTNVSLFHTTGTVFFIGAILTIIFIGFIIIWVSFILLIIAFYESKPMLPTQQPQAQTPP